MLVYCSEHTQSLEVGRLAIAYPSSKLSCTHCSVTTFFLSFHAAGHRDHLASSFFFLRERGAPGTQRARLPVKRSASALVRRCRLGLWFGLEEAVDGVLVGEGN